MRILILLLIVYGLMVLPAYCQEPPAKTYAEPLYQWTDDQGVKHVEVQSKVPPAELKPKKKRGKTARFFIGVRNFTMQWITPGLQTWAGVRSILNP